MGAIQSAINQGLATAGILYSQSDLAEQRKKDFADKREVKDIDKQLGQLKGARQELSKQVGEMSKKLEKVPRNTPKEEMEYLDEKEAVINNMQSGMDLYQGMTTDLTKRKFEITKDPNDLRMAQFESASKDAVKNQYDTMKADMANKRALLQKEMAESIKAKNVTQELRRMRPNDEQQ